MAYILLWSSAVRVHDSQAYRKMDVTRERITARPNTTSCRQHPQKARGQRQQAAEHPPEAREVKDSKLRKLQTAPSKGRRPKTASCRQHPRKAGGQRQQAADSTLKRQEAKDSKLQTAPSKGRRPKTASCRQRPQKAGGQRQQAADTPLKGRRPNTASCRRKKSAVQEQPGNNPIRLSPQVCLLQQRLSLSI